MSAISDTNNPYATVADELEEHFGTPSGGSNIVAFIPAATVAKTRALTDFVAVSDMGIQPGADTAQAVGLPANVPGRIIGRMDGSGVWVVRVAVHPGDLPAGDSPGCAEAADAARSIRITPAWRRACSWWRRMRTIRSRTSEYVHRTGFGVGNRLNGVAMIVSAAGYSVPTGY